MKEEAEAHRSKIKCSARTRRLSDDMPIGRMESARSTSEACAVQRFARNQIDQSDVA